MQFFLVPAQLRHGDSHPTHTVKLLSATKGAGQALTQLALPAINSGATETLQLRHVLVALTQVAQLELHGSHCMLLKLATVVFAGQVVRQLPAW